jgi:uncharacterized protein YbjQ (UPF0145 family)
MIIVTTNKIEGKEIAETLGLVKGSTIRSKDVFRDIMAGFRTIVGGEIKVYTKAIEEARQEAMDRMVKEAEELSADAIVGMRFATSQVMPGAAEILAYGTAVKLGV